MAYTNYRSELAVTQELVNQYDINFKKIAKLFEEEKIKVECYEKIPSVIKNTKWKYAEGNIPKSITGYVSLPNLDFIPEFIFFLTDFGDIYDRVKYVGIIPAIYKRIMPGEPNYDEKRVSYRGYLISFKSKTEVSGSELLGTSLFHLYYEYPEVSVSHLNKNTTWFACGKEAKR